MTKSIKVIGLLLLTISSQEIFNVQPSFAKKNILKDVSVKSELNQVSLELEFENPVRYRSPRYFSKTIQIDFPSTSISSSYKYFPTSDSELVQVYVSRLDTNTLRLRLILEEGGDDIVKRFSIKRKGNYLRLSLKKNSGSLESLLARANKIKEIQRNEVSGKKFEKVSVEEREEKGGKNFPPNKNRQNSSLIKNGQEPLSEVVGKNFVDKKNDLVVKERSSIKKDKNLLQLENDKKEFPDLLSTSLKMFYTLSIVLGVMFIVYYLFKRFFWNNGSFGKDPKPIKILSSGFLAPKKSIALVEISDQVLIVGISNDNISLLGNIEDKDRILKIKGKSGSPEKSEKSILGLKKNKVKEVKGIQNNVSNNQANQERSGSTNPFPEYIKKYSSSELSKSPSNDGMDPLLKKKKVQLA